MKNTYTAGVLQKDNKLLMLYHAAADRWVFPGGKPECDEDVWQCIRRELLEEIAVYAGTVEFSHVVPSTIVNDKEWFGLIFEIKTWRGEPEAMEVKPEHMKWFTIPEITWEPERSIARRIASDGE